MDIGNGLKLPCVRLCSISTIWAPNWELKILSRNKASRTRKKILRKKCIWPNQLNFIYCCRHNIFFMCISCTIFVHWCNKQTNGERPVAGKLIVAHCQLAICLLEWWHYELWRLMKIGLFIWTLRAHNRLMNGQLHVSTETTNSNSNDHIYSDDVNGVEKVLDSFNLATF